MKEHSWLVSVLDDLETYAKMNQLPSLSEELTKARTIAAAEISGDRGDLKAAMCNNRDSDYEH